MLVRKDAFLDVSENLKNLENFILRVPLDMEIFTRGYTGFIRFVEPWIFIYISS